MAVTQARLNRYRDDVDSYGDAAASYVDQYISALIAENPGIPVAELREEAIEAIEDALNAFGDQASMLALDLFDEIVEQCGIDAESSVVDVIPREMIDGGVRYRARDIVEGSSDKFTRDVADLTRYYIHRSAFENMERNCERNDLRYARVPSGRETCGFCFMLSSRGFVYRSEQTAGSTHAYHRNCDCVIVPGFERLPASEQVEGYDPDGMYERWKMCEKTIGGDKALRALWDGMDAKDRARYKGNSDAERYRKFAAAQVRHEVETRDWRWLNSGAVPDVEYASAQVEKRATDAEVRTAERLCSNGVRSRFMQDFEWVIEDDGRKRKVGLPDLEGGIEIKTLGSSKNAFGAVDNYLESSSKKKGLTCVVIDNSESLHISDSDLVEAATRVIADYDSVPHLRLILKSGLYLEIK